MNQKQQQTITRSLPTSPIRPVVETQTAANIRAVLDGTAKRAHFSFIFGQTGRGKTYVAKDWMRRNPNSSYIRCHTGSTIAKLRKQISFELLGHERGSYREIVDYINSRPGHVVIIDEANHLIMDSGSLGAAKNLDFIRDIWEDVNEASGGGVALMFTSCTIKAFYHGRMAGFLEQFVGRIGNHLDIPHYISKRKEILPAVAEYVDNPSHELIDAAHRIAAGGKGKMRTLYKYLTLAQELAEQQNTPITSKMLDAIQRRYEDGGNWSED